MTKPIYLDYNGTMPHAPEVTEVMQIPEQWACGTLRFSTGRYEGNFLELFDASHWLSEYYHLANENFPQEFLTQLSSCDQDCHTCDYCSTFFEQHAGKKPLHFADFRKYKEKDES